VPKASKLREIPKAKPAANKSRHSPTRNYKPWSWEHRHLVPDRLVKRTTGTIYGVFAIHRHGIYINYPQQSFFDWKQVLQQFETEEFKPAGMSHKLK